MICVTSPSRSTKGSYWLVRLGLVDVRSTGDSEQAFKVTTVHVHPSYNSTTDENDIALIKLHQPATLSKDVNTICLPEQNTKDLYKPGNICHVAGWGISQPTGDTVYPLSSMTLPLVSNSQCNNFADFVVTDHMLCAGHRDGGVDTCQGDGGGALMCNSKERFVAVGINSAGKGCGEEKHFGVYTDVRPFLDWIKIQLFA